LGNAYQSLGQYYQAIDFYQHHYEIAREIGDLGSEAISLGNLGIAHDSLGQYQRAIDFHQQYYEIAREIGDRWGEGASLLNMGITLAQLDRHDEALQSYQQALAIFEQLKLDHMVERCQTAIAKYTQPPTRQPRRWWQKWGLWFAIGVAIVLVIWWVRR
jgi:tetratricopeptide (TPR) repeat protein